MACLYSRARRVGVALLILLQVASAQNISVPFPGLPFIDPRRGPDYPSGSVIDASAGTTSISLFMPLAAVMGTITLAPSFLAYRLSDDSMPLGFGNTISVRCGAVSATPTSCVLNQTLGDATTTTSTFGRTDALNTMRIIDITAGYEKLSTQTTTPPPTSASSSTSNSVSTSASSAARTPSSAGSSAGAPPTSMPSSAATSAASVTSSRAAGSRPLLRVEDVAIGLGAAVGALAFAL